MKRLILLQLVIIIFPLYSQENVFKSNGLIFLVSEIDDRSPVLDSPVYYTLKYDKEDNVFTHSIINQDNISHSFYIGRFKSAKILNSTNSERHRTIFDSEIDYRIKKDMFIELLPNQKFTFKQEVESKFGFVKSNRAFLQFYFGSYLFFNNSHDFYPINKHTEFYGKYFLFENIKLKANELNIHNLYIDEVISNKQKVVE
ncbi:hypothetical protein EW093_03070 [Thiospirochaeta perfilievii]|uniref:Uncharacterized protein n=1 Tax=Thiospirochaeta perfilievii TaxID=252967 RepID=A0A5C1QBY8_9SPIO|nr:hypothetical protein [Thiospirochaeta perfilievii]QEN03722.1 hypothetical protein EW093_03070 [Thiospirochaeta perfilievii]